MIRGARPGPASDRPLRAGARARPERPTGASRTQALAPSGRATTEAVASSSWAARSSAWSVSRSSSSAAGWPPCGRPVGTRVIAAFANAATARGARAIAGAWSPSRCFDQTLWRFRPRTVAIRSQDQSASRARATAARFPRVEVLGDVAHGEEGTGRVGGIEVLGHLGGRPRLRVELGRAGLHGRSEPVEERVRALERVLVPERVRDGIRRSADAERGIGPGVRGQADRLDAIEPLVVGGQLPHEVRDVEQAASGSPLPDVTGEGVGEDLPVARELLEVGGDARPGPVLVHVISPDGGRSAARDVSRVSLS